MTASQQRKVQRAVHVLAGLLIVVFVYGPENDRIQDAVRFVALPVVVLTGLAMWQAARIRRFQKRVQGTVDKA